MMSWARKLGVRAIGIWPLILVILVTIFGAAAWPLFNIAPSKLGVHNDPMITMLVYPTFGNPAIVEKGASLTLEFDPRERDFDEGLIELHEFEVTAVTSNDPYPMTESLPVVSSDVGCSSRWPEYGESGSEDRRIYLVTVEVPDSVPEDLYDIYIRAGDAYGEWLEDSQPHALSAVESYKDRFSFCQLTDIHVWGPECEYPSAVYHERSGRPNGIDPDRKGAVYYQKVIEQVNLMKPDFCVFTGDYDFGQSYFIQDQGPPWKETTEYEYEMMWFYEETLKLDVPVFMIPGNHDSYNEGEEGAQEDWFVNWRKLFGPEYYTFDYGDYHYLALNSMDWAPEERVLVDWDAGILQPTKYKGQFRAGGDPLEAGISEERLEEVDQSGFTEQLAWARDDLEAHQDARMRVCLMHHDPFKENGSGVMWGAAPSKSGAIGWLKDAANRILDMGNGQGRLAAIRLMRDYRVALELSGHDHSDYVGSMPWENGEGELLFVNTTSVQFESDSESDRYPGYRRIWINGGLVESYNYIDPKWSYPSYEGTNVGGETDLGKLVDPAIQASFSAEPGGSQYVTLTILNSLIKPLPEAYAEFVMPYLSGGYYYQVSGGTIWQAHDSGTIPPDYRVYQVRTDVAPGEKKEVQVYKSSQPDLAEPAGELTIDEGASTTDSLRVTLNISAVDNGGSGVMGMMISNNPDFDGAEWQPYDQTITWSLEPGAGGERTVYVMFRDYAMPGNTSGVSKASISYSPPR